MTVSEMIERREGEYLSPLAFPTSCTRGRQKPIAPCDNRAEYQRDRDRILHSKAFRRLMHKTQVFISPEHDHYRTRLTHTLEVTQVARTIARALRLNEDLCEAIALGHDLGHTPFGHSGEAFLRRFDPSFAHYEQSLRVVDTLERLDLTYEVRDGIVHHTAGGACTAEGEVIRAADHIAYINHDIDDALRAGILHYGDIPADITAALGQTHGERIDVMVQSIIDASVENDFRFAVSGNDGKSVFAPASESALTAKTRSGYVCPLRMGAEVEDATRRLHEFLYERVYKNPIAKSEEVRAERMLSVMYDYFLKNPDSLPGEYKLIALSDGVNRAVCDYISGMTDRYAVSVFKSIFEPETWKI
ncbi:MAG: deoxyguanosinetriphosphate triphosphohydrolase [Eubacteriales bacterium]